MNPKAPHRLQTVPMKPQPQAPTPRARHQPWQAIAPRVFPILACAILVIPAIQATVQNHETGAPTWDKLPGNVRQAILLETPRLLDRLGPDYQDAWQQTFGGTWKTPQEALPAVYDLAIRDAAAEHPQQDPSAFLLAIARGMMQHAKPSDSAPSYNGSPASGQQRSGVPSLPWLPAAQELARALTGHGLPSLSPDSPKSVCERVSEPLALLGAVTCLVSYALAIPFIVVFLAVAVVIIVVLIAVPIAVPIAQSTLDAAIAIATPYADSAAAAAQGVPPTVDAYATQALSLLHARLDKYLNPTAQFITQSASILATDLGLQTQGGPTLQQASFRLPEDHDYSVAWAGPVVYAFGGWKDGDTAHQDRVWKVETGTGDATLLGAHLPSGTGASWIPVYDGHNVYLFSRMNLTPNPTAASALLRYDIQNDTFQSLPFAPTTPCCLSASYDGSAIDLFAQPISPVLLEYNPRTGIVQSTHMPIPPAWQEGTPVTVGSDTYYVGGQPTTPTKDPAATILRYQPASQNAAPIAVPGSHSTTAPPAFAFGRSLYVLDGASGNLTQARDPRMQRIDLDTLTATTLATRLPEPLAGGLAFWAGTQALILHNGTVYTYNLRDDHSPLDAAGAGGWWSNLLCRNAQGDAGALVQSGADACSLMSPQTVPQPPCAQCDSPTAQPHAPASSRYAAVNHIESVHQARASIPADAAHDHDGVPDALQSVYLPSQASQHTALGDTLNLLDGLPSGGLAFLLEPGHREAQLVLADASTTATNFAGLTSTTPLLTASQALDRIEANQGVQARNALSMVLNEGMRIHYTLLGPETPATLNLTWTGGAIPADGSWLLVQTDPTRLVSLVLAGNPVSLVPRAASHFSAPTDTDWRYQFLNLQSGGATFCYDPSTTTGATECRGYEWPGWIRAYSGQAAYALDALRSGLASGALSLTTTPPTPADDPQAQAQAASEDAPSNATIDPTLQSCPSPRQGAVADGRSLCTTMPQTCPSGMVGLAMNGQPLCLPQPTVGVCPAGALGGVANGQPACFAQPTAASCPAGLVGITVNGQSACFMPLVPGITSACPSGMAGLTVDSQTVRDQSTGDQPLCAPAPPAFGTCPGPQAGLFVGAQPACATPPPLTLCPSPQQGVVVAAQPACLIPPASCPPAEAGLIVNGQTECVPIPAWASCPSGQQGVVANGQPDCHTVNPCPSGAGAQVDGSGPCQPVPVPCTSPGIGVMPTCMTPGTCDPPTTVGATLDDLGGCQANPCPSPAGTPGPGQLAVVCGQGVPDACPTPVGSAPDALVVACGVPVPGPCPPPSVGVPPGCHTATVCASGLGVQVDGAGPCQPVPSSCASPGVGIDPACATPPCNDPTNLPSCIQAGQVACPAGTGPADPLYTSSCALADILDGALRTAGMGSVTLLAGRDADGDGRPDVAQINVQEPAIQPAPLATLYLQLDYFYTPAGATPPYQASASNFDYPVTGVMPYDPATGGPATNAATLNGLRFTDHYGDQPGQPAIYRFDPATHYGPRFVVFDPARLTLDVAGLHLDVDLTPGEGAGCPPVNPTIGLLAVLSNNGICDNSIGEQHYPTQIYMRLPDTVAAQTGGVCELHIKRAGASGGDFSRYDLYSDLDDDGVTDEQEILARTNPLVDESGNHPCVSAPAPKDSDGDGIPDDQEDKNHNGNFDSGETNPGSPDTDGDGLTDCQETGYVAGSPNGGKDGVPDPNVCRGLQRYHTNPVNHDSDGDGFVDGVEVAVGSNPADSHSVPRDQVPPLPPNRSNPSGTHHPPPAPAGANLRPYGGNLGSKVRSDAQGNPASDPPGSASPGLPSAYASHATRESGKGTPALQPRTARDAPRPPSTLPPSPLSVPGTGVEDEVDSIFNANSTWHLLGNQSHELPVGVGIDYLLDPQGLPAAASSRITQVDDSMMDGQGTGVMPAAVQRLFQFQGAYYSTPALPRNLTHIKLGIQDLDGNPEGQTFLIDGKRLVQLLDIRDGESLNVTIDDGHKAGFNYTVRDVDGDGVPDLLVHVPHFSATWMTISNQNVYGDFKAVKLTSSTTGWIGGRDYPHGAIVYRYASGIVDGSSPYVVPGTDGWQAARGLFVVSDSEFYAVGNSDCGNNNYDLPFIAHWRNGWVDVQRPSSIRCEHLDSIWMNGDQTLGYAGGDSGVWMKYTPSTGWVRQTSPSDCAIKAIRFDSTGKGLVAFAIPYCGGGGLRGVAYFDGSAFSSVSGNSVDFVDDIQGSWAAGTVQQGPGIYHLNGNTWSQATDSQIPDGNYHGIARQGTANITWFVGISGRCYPNDCGNSGLIVSNSAGTWANYASSDSIPDLFGISMTSSSRFGLAVGGTTIVQFQDTVPPIVVGSLSASSGDTKTQFSADGSGSYSPKGQSITQQWSWGDASAPVYSAVSTHRYNNPGTFTVMHTVWDTDQYQSSQNFTVQIAAGSLLVDHSVSDSFTSSWAQESHHYKIASASGDRFVKVQLTGPNIPSSAIASLDAIPLSTGSWPSNGASTSAYYYWNGPLVGRIPSGSYLDIKMQNLGYGGSGSLAYTLSVTTLPTPLAPSTSFASGTYLPQVGFSATAPHNGARPTRLVVDWGDGSQSQYPSASSFGAAGTTYYPSHTYAATGANTLTLTTLDDAGQAASVTRSVTIHKAPQGSATGATAINAVQATLNGQATDLGGVSSITVTYKLYTGSTLVASSTGLTTSSTGSLPTWTPTGLTSGMSYTYTVSLANDVATTTTPASAFQTVSPLSILPVAVSNSGSVALGSAYSLGLQASASHATNVSYWVRWDPSLAEVRYPASGYVAWNQTVTATQDTAYAFAGAHAITVHLQDSALARSSALAVTATATGSPPISSFTHTAQLDTVTLSATVGSLGLSSGVSLRFNLQDPATGAWSIHSSWTGNVSAGQAVSWASDTLDRSKTYKAQVEMSTSDGQAWITPAGGWLSVQTNRMPTLAAGSMPAQVNYLDTTRFSVIYADAEGDAPTSSVNLTVNGQSYTMYASSSGALDYVSGVEYHYNLPNGTLPEGQTTFPTYSVTDQYARTVSAQGAGVNAARKFLTDLDFEGDVAGGLPQGMTSGGESLNYWHVVDTQASNMPNRIALGHHGKALWFADAVRGTYQDPQGGVPRGTLVLPAMDLGQVMSPALSFSSYYETQDKGVWKDMKLVEACNTSHDCSQQANWTVLQQVSGDEGGYGAWRTQHVSLSAYAGQAVDIRFTFDAIDNVDNGHLGWLIDDIAIGHDHDNDTLPDILEETRHDVLVASQVAAVQIQPGQQGASYVRRLVRPFADSFQLEALVSSSHPSDLTVTIGVTPSLQDNQQHSFVLYSGGVDHSGCITTSDNGVETFQNRTAVLNRGDGLDIRLDLAKCAANLSSIPSSVVSEPRNWFLNVQVPSGSSVAWIDMLRIVTSGKTDFMQFDTNHDGVSDGVKVNLGHDPLGYDADQDGIPNAIDPDDTVPSWAPALKVFSSDYTKLMELSFHDLLVPLNTVSVQAIYNATGQSKDLSSTYKDGTTWTVNPNQYNQFPDGLAVKWRDVYGTTGTITYWMGPQDTAVFVPKVIVSQAVDDSTGKTVKMSVSLAGVPTPQRSVVEFGTATAYANTYDGKAYQGQLMSIIGTPLITAAQATLNFVVAAARVVAACAVAVFNFFGSVIGATITATAAVVAAAVDNTVNGFRIIVEYTTQQFDGVSAGQLDQVTKEGQVRIDDAGNVILIRIDGGKIIGAVAKAIGDGVVRVGNVLARSVQLPVGSWDQLIGEGYGNFCGPTTFSLDYNPVDELDTSCFIHDWCVPQKDISSDRLWTIPFSRIKSVKTCNEQLMENSSNSDCELPIDSWIGTAIPEPIEGRYKLPVGSWSDSHGNWHNPAIQVQEMTTGALSPCNRNREAILDGFGFGHAIATMPTVIV